MTRHFLHALEDLDKEVLAMGGAVEAAVGRPVRAFMDHDAAACREVIDGDRAIDLHELKIDEECLKILALHQPTARDLRFVTGVMKIINDLERVADLAGNIAERGQEMAALPARDVPPALVEMADRVRAMLTASLDALVNRDAARAREVLSMDEAVDAFLKGLFDAMEADMAERPSEIRRDLKVLSAARNLERIADHASNGAEDVVYMVEGTVLRHRT